MNLELKANTKHLAIYDGERIACFVHMDEIRLTGFESRPGRYMLDGFIGGWILLSDVWCTRIKDLKADKDLSLCANIVSYIRN